MRNGPSLMFRRIPADFSGLCCQLIISDRKSAIELLIYMGEYIEWEWEKGFCSILFISASAITHTHTQRREEDEGW